MRAEITITDSTESTVINMTVSVGGVGGGLPDAPHNGRTYGRKDAKWVEIPGANTPTITDQDVEKWNKSEQSLTKIEQDAASPTLTPNTHNVWASETASVDLSALSFTDWAESDEVVIQLLSGDSACDLSLPDSIIWLNDNPTAPESNALYILSIKIIGGSPIAVGGVAYV